MATFYSKCTRALTFENVRLKPPLARLIGERLRGCLNYALLKTDKIFLYVKYFLPEATTRAPHRREASRLLDVLSADVHQTIGHARQMIAYSHRIDWPDAPAANKGRICMCVCMCICMCMYVQRPYMYVYMHVYVCVCMRMYVYMYMYSLFTPNSLARCTCSQQRPRAGHTFSKLSALANILHTGIQRGLLRMQMHLQPTEAARRTHTF